jgi:hypothetical protein
MDYMNDLLTQLEKGVSVDDLAAQLTKALNDANNQFQKAEQEKNKVRDRKITALREVLAAVDELLGCYGLDGVSDDVDAEDLGELVDELDSLIQKTNELNELLRKSPFGGSLEEYKPAHKVHSLPDWKRESVEKDPIEEFLNKFVR